MLSPPEILLVFLVAGFSAFAAQFWLGRQCENRSQADTVNPEPIAMLFDDGILHHGTAAALSRFSLLPGAHLWGDLREALKDRFPDFPHAPGNGEPGSVTLLANGIDDLQEITISWRGSLCWVTCVDRQNLSTSSDDQRIPAMQRAVDTTPHPAWQMDRQGKVIWFNSAYQALFHCIHGEPPRADVCLFPRPEDRKPGRAVLTTPTGDTPLWFDISTHEEDGVTIHHASSISELVRAEDAQRKFVQTLAKTFAHLPIGLAIFNRNDQLVLFNPALLELSDLKAEFLSARPNMLSFFDQLRENRRMPEPKNYGDWRQEIAELVCAAADGRYNETWSLEDGRTYSVQGRPHPDGATVFLFEDISAEISLTRNFRAELELSQYMLDKVDDCIAVFSPSGVLAFCNHAYRDLWQQNPDTAFADITISDCVAVWRSKAKADLPWHSFLKIPGYHGNRLPLTSTITLSDGQMLSCVAETIASGETLIRFRNLQPFTADIT